MTTPTRSSERLLSTKHRALTIGGVTLVGMSAFEVIAVSTAMPTVATALNGLDEYPLAFGIPLAGSIVGMVAAGSWSDRTGPVGALVTGWVLFVAGSDVVPAVRASLQRFVAAVAASIAACVFSVAGQQPAPVAIVLTVGGAGLLVWSVPKLLPAGTYRASRGLPTVILLRGLTGAAFAGAEVLLPLLLSRERGLSPTQAGIVLTVGALGWSAGSAWQGRYSTAARRSAMLTVGLGALAFGIAVASSTVWSAVPLPVVFVGWVISGLGIGIAYPTLTVLTLELSAPDEAGRNTSALQVNESLAQAFTLAISGAVFAALFSRSTWASYAAGFAIAGLAALIGAVLARRVRPR